MNLKFSHNFYWSYLLEILKQNKFQKTKKLSLPPISDFAFPIYVQRRSRMGITIICPDMNIARTLPLPNQYESSSDFYHDLMITMIEVDRLAVEEFKKRDLNSNKKHRETLFPRGLKDHLEIDIHKLRFKPPIASKLTTKSLRTWQRWCKERLVKRRTNGKDWSRKHYLIPFSEIEPHLKQEFIENPTLILTYLN